MLVKDQDTGRSYARRTETDRHTVPKEREAGWLVYRGLLLEMKEGIQSIDRLIHFRG